MSTNIAIIEDEKSLITMLKYNLEKEGFRVTSAETGDDGLKLLKSQIPDLLILDWMLPDFSGIEICRHIKRDTKLKSIPVLMLTARSEEDDKIRGFETGVDDYVTKTFNNKELLLRVKSLLKRAKPSLLEDVAIFKDLKVDRITKKVFRASKEIKLGPTEFKLLNFFIKSPQRVYSREQLLNSVWGENINVEARTVDVHIRRLRKAINIDNKEDLIRTVRSSGYSLDF